MNNKGPIINGEQLVSLLNEVLGNYLVNADLNPISKHVIQRKLSLLNEYINVLNKRTEEKTFLMTSQEIQFNVGEHANSNSLLILTILFVHKTNKSLNREVSINIPKSYFTNILSNNEACIDPHIIYSSSSENRVPISIGLRTLRDKNSGAIIKALYVNLFTEEFNEFEYITITADTFSTIFEEIPNNTTDYEFVSELIHATTVNPVINIGDHKFVINNGQVVFSDIVNQIKLVTNEEMTNLLADNTTNPNNLYLVSEKPDDTDRALKLRFKTTNPNTRIELTNNINQSTSYTVNWGDGTEDQRINHRYDKAGEYQVTIYHRIDDLYINTPDPSLELLEISIPNGYRTPCEWNEPIVSQPFNGNRFKASVTTVPEGIFDNGKNIIRLLGIVDSPNVSFVGRALLRGMGNLIVFESQGLFKNLTAINADLFNYTPRIRSIRYLLKDSKVTTVPATLCDPLDELEDVTGLLEGTSLTHLPPNFLATCYDIKNVDYMLKGVTTLNDVDITPFFTSFISDKRLLRSMKGILDGTPAVIHLGSQITELMNLNKNLMDLSFAFRSSKVVSQDYFVLREMPNIVTIESMFENVPTFNVFGPILIDVSNLNNTPINVTNCLSGASLTSDEILSEDDLYINTMVDGGSGLVI